MMTPLAGRDENAVEKMGQRDQTARSKSTQVDTIGRLDQAKCICAVRIGSDMYGGDCDEMIQASRFDPD
jgi:hypothetical protein